MEIIVGREGQQGIKISDSTVSRKHCKITKNSDGTYTIENLSKNGTYVNGQKIIKTNVTADTEIQLGPVFRITVKQLLAGSGGYPEDFIAKFRKLEEVYDKYSNDKIAIQKQAAKINFYRMLPMALLSLITLGSLAIPGLGSISPFIGLIGGGLVLYSLVKFYSSNTGNPEKIEALNKQFMIDYVCPKCGNFLGFIPHKTLANKSTCNYCKCKWS